MRQPFRDRWFLTLAPLLLMALAGGGVWAWKRARPPAPVAPVAPQPTPAVAEAARELNFTAAIQPQLLVPVAAPIEGVLETIEAAPGGEVEEGQLLGRIRNDGIDAARSESQQDVERVQTRLNNLESSLIQARLESSRALADSERARTESERAEKAANRQQLLYNEKATPRLTYEKAQKDYAQAKADSDAARETSRQAEERVKVLIQDLDAARRMLDEKNKLLEAAQADQALAEVHSPVNGVFVSAAKAVGDEVDPSIRDLFQISVDPSQWQAPLDPDPKAAELLKEGLPALVQILEISGDAIPGEVAKSGAGQWRVEFTSNEPGLKPGLNAIVKVRLP